MCLGIIPNHFVLIYLKNGCPLPPSSTEWHNHKKEDAVTWEDENLDQHELFRKFMAIESGKKPPKPQKESNKAAPILLDTPEKPKQQFEVIAEDEEYSISLYLPINKITNRVESAHALFTVIQTTFGQSVTVLEHRFKDVTLYSDLGHLTGYHVHAKLLLNSLKRSQFSWMRYTTIDIGYVWAKKVMKLVFFVEVELKAIVECLKKLPFQMKLEVKEGLRQLAFPETTMMSPPLRKVPTKGAKKKVDIASKTSLSPLPPPSRYPKPKAILVMRPIDYIARFMLPFIENVLDVLGDGHCGFRAIAEFMGLTEKNHIMIRTHLIQELKDHRDDYVEVFAGEDRYNYILNGLHPPANMKGCAHLVDKWLTFPDMRHIVANYYERATTPGKQKTPIMCLGVIPNHFVLIYFKNGCPLPPSSTEWHNHKKEDAVTWEDEYLDQHELFRKLMAIESGNKSPKPQKESNKAAPILLDTPEKPKQQFEVIAEDEEDSISLDLPQSLGL
ncbi:OTU-like cysteine protease [Medicago truncatula]|uniref:OTU-like cysteine protease n=1 Tax=Medicago truncatula TaxID=3880 RepID=A0A072TPX1_MEDTR|nr:OTU-like cysteine protease [Medicago truncatula]